MDIHELAGEIAVLKAEAAANRWLGISLAASLVHNKAIDANVLVETIEATAAMISLTDGENEALYLLNTLEHLKPLLNTLKGLGPKELMAIRASMYIDAGPDHKDALETWMQHASHEELGEDVQELFTRLKKKRSGRPEESNPDEPS